MGAAVWFVPIVLFACKSPTPRPTAKIGAGPKSGPARAHASESGASEIDARTSECETGGEVPASEIDAQTSETGASETGEPRSGGARLCSRPYELSSTPGKGTRASNTRPQADAKAREQLERGFEVSVAGRPAQAWTSTRGVVFDELDPTIRHTIFIREPGGAKVKAMILDFERRDSEELCLGLNSFYMTWQLRSLRPGAGCGPCTTRAPR